MPPNRIASLFIFAVGTALLSNAHAHPPRSRADVPERISPNEKAKPDLSGRARVGVASFYASTFFGRTMANGIAMDPRGNNAASRTLPLGTVAKITNLETGKSAVVTIQDRGPYVKGRIVDLSPTTARKIGITRRKGISKVVVAPVAVPLPNGTVKSGIAAREPSEHHRALREARERLATTTRR
ncbi:MAG TPA: septal ring lytic transglycosylase RlpA family protein [Steroidobacteraceae bacterium]|nr:septal ring lytic transglycosylase RlpA family protein [Steroidobacteraceae bacterium]